LSGWAADETARELAVGYATAGRALRFLGQLESANYDQALRYFDRSIGADPTFMYAYFSQGAIHNEREAHDNAIARYQLAIEINPSAQIFTRAGAYLRKYERHIDSIQMFQKAAELNPSANAYAYWGMALRASGRPEEARKRFQRAIDTDPSSPNGYNQLGLMYLEQQKWDEAVENFLQAIRLSPQWSNYYYNLSRAFRGAGKVKEATDAMKKAIEIYKSHPQGPYGIGRVGASARGSSGRANGSDCRGELKSASGSQAACRADNKMLLMDVLRDDTIKMRAAAKIAGWTKAVEKVRRKQAALAEQASVASRLRLAEPVRAPEAPSEY